MRAAVISIGTNSCRLLIASIGPDGRFTPEYHESRGTRRGEGIAPGHMPEPAAPEQSRGPLPAHHPTRGASKGHNVLQKITYLIVIFVLLPLVILMGFAMSPGLDSLIPGWVGIVGGRQSARTIHFLVAWLLVAFVSVHVFEVAITGLWNNLRSMITGRYRVEGEARDESR